MAGEEQPTAPPEVLGSGSIQRNVKPEESQALVPVQSHGGLTQLPFSESLRELRGIRGEAAMVLLCTHANRLEVDVKELRSEKEGLVKTSNDWMRSYYSEKERSAVLTSQLDGVSRVKNIQKFVGAIGGVVAGVAIPFSITGPLGWGLAGSAVGLLLLVAGFWPTSVRKG